ncbi:MAG: ABC transporter ATP-binding protein/permease [Mollicutes bacterium]|nr:ABC transporter ATP-binding protein/permease [Mollicutes bacterium]
MLFGKYINKYYLKYWAFFLIGIIFLIVVDYLQLYVPEFLGQIIDFFDNGSVAGHEKEIGQIIIYVILVSFGMFFGRVVWRLSIFHASTGIEASLRQEMFLKSERLSQRYYHETKVGNIISWFTTDLETIEEFFGWGTIMLVDASFLSLFVLIKMFILDWALTLITLIPILLIVVWGAIVEKFMSMKWEYRQKETDRLYDFTQENFTGIRVIKAFVKENSQLFAFSKIARKNKDVNIDFVRISVIFDVLISIIIALITSIILGFGGYFVYLTIKGIPLVIFGKEILFSAGNLVTFIGYFDLLIWPMMALGQIFTMRSRAKTSLKRVSNFLDQEEEIKNVDNPIFIKNIKGKIEFKNFSFTYPNGQENSLKNISFVVNPGETIGIVGKIGSGKTTLVNSLLRLYNIDNDKIFIDDVDLMRCDITSLRNEIAYVPQDNFLFSDKVSNNISFGRRNASFEKIRDAAIFADVNDNIVNFKEGYDTVSGERGVTLSGGQKQRISIARAYIKESPIMIMDDSVSAVDVKTEETILKHIKENRKNMTTLVVASRISTVMNLDKILVLDEGKLVGYDSHKELIKTCPVYQKMVYLQELEREVEGGK